MYICNCRAVTLSRIRTAIRDGAGSVDEVEAHCGAGGDCGSCRSEIEGIILEEGGGCGGCPLRSLRDSSASRAA